MCIMAVKWLCVCLWFNYWILLERQRDKWSNNFDERLHHHLVTTRGSEWICPSLTPFNTCFLGPTWVSPLKRHLDWFNHFLHTPQQRLKFIFWWGGQPRNCTFLGGFGPHLIYHSLSRTLPDFIQYLTISADSIRHLHKRYLFARY